MKIEHFSWFVWKRCSPFFFGCKAFSTNWALAKGFLFLRIFPRFLFHLLYIFFFFLFLLFLFFTHFYSFYIIRHGFWFNTYLFAIATTINHKKMTRIKKNTSSYKCIEMHSKRNIFDTIPRKSARISQSGERQKLQVIPIFFASCLIYTTTHAHIHIHTIHWSVVLSLYVHIFAYKIFLFVLL